MKQIVYFDTFYLGMFRVYAGVMFGYSQMDAPNDMLFEELTLGMGNDNGWTWVQAPKALPHASGNTAYG